MQKLMMKDVKIFIKINQPFKIFIILIGFLILGCNKGERLYLDYNEIVLRSNAPLDIIDEDHSFMIYNEKDTIYLSRMESEIKVRKLDYLEKITITPIDTAIKRLSKITFDNLNLEKEKGLPQLFIVDKDYLNNEVKIIEVGQSFVISEDNFDVN